MESEIRLGVMLTCVSLDDLEHKAALAQAAGFEHCQVTVRWEIMPGEAVVAEETCLRRGLAVAAWGAYINLLRPDDEAFHGVSVEGAYNLIEAMRETACRRLVVWSGTHGKRLMDPHPDNATREAREAALTEASDLAARLRVHSGFLCLEPYYLHVLRTPADYVGFAREVDEDVVRVVLDPPNFISPEEYPRLPELLPEIVAAVGPMAGLVHFKDIALSRRGAIELPAPGKGALDYARFVGAVREQGLSLTGIIEHIDENSLAAMRQARAYVEQFL